MAQSSVGSNSLTITISDTEPEITSQPRTQAPPLISTIERQVHPKDPTLGKPSNCLTAHQYHKEFLKCTARMCTKRSIHPYWCAKCKDIHYPQ